MFRKYVEVYLKSSYITKIKDCYCPLLLSVYSNNRKTIRTLSRIRNKINIQNNVKTNEEENENFGNKYENESEKIETEADKRKWNNKFHICFENNLNGNRETYDTDTNGDNKTNEKYGFIFKNPTHLAHINDEPIIRRPGSIINIKTLLRNNWSFPAVGFNSKLEIPVYKFETDENEENYNKIKFINVPSEIFGLPIRSDILHKCYYFYRTALAGYTERMQLYKWEWPGSTKKYRSQKKSGKARMNWRKTSGRYLGVKNHPIRPHDQRTRINRKFLWKGLKIMLSAKFAQDEIRVVDNFLVKSHKTKYTVKYLRNILGNKCNSALLVHEGKTDVNNNFLWACANIASVKRENVEGVNIYNLLKYRYVIFTFKALQNLIYEIKIYPFKNKWMPTYATPNNKKAPLPEKVKNWNLTWEEKKKRNNFAYFNKEDLKKRIQEWKWSSNLKGPLKVKKKDDYKNFILTKFQYQDPLPEHIKYEYLFQTDDAETFNESEKLQMLEEMLNEEDEFLQDASELSCSLTTQKGKHSIDNVKGENDTEGSHTEDEDDEKDDDDDDEEEEGGGDDDEDEEGDGYGRNGEDNEGDKKSSETDNEEDNGENINDTDTVGKIDKPHK